MKISSTFCILAHIASTASSSARCELLIQMSWWYNTVSLCVCLLVTMWDCLTPPHKYDWTNCVWRQCGLSHLFFVAACCLCDDFTVLHAWLHFAQHVVPSLYCWGWMMDWIPEETKTSLTKWTRKYWRDCNALLNITVHILQTSLLSRCSACFRSDVLVVRTVRPLTVMLLRVLTRAHLRWPIVDKKETLYYTDLSCRRATRVQSQSLGEMFGVLIRWSVTGVE